LSQDKRKYNRLEASLPLTIQTAQTQIQGRTTNISEGGAFVYCDQMLPPNENFRLSLKPTDRPSLDITAKIVWIGTPRDPLATSPGMGIQFLETSDLDRQYLSSMIANNI
jgi:uncharacterized protein (TIGR02266 family)